MLVTPLALREGPAALEALPVLARALEGEGPLLVPHAAGTPPPTTVSEAEGVPRDAALAVGTSGSTGRPKLAVLSAAALRASADATHEVVGGSGVWLLALPPHHIAGLQVLLRSLAAGHTPVAVQRHSSFAPHHLADAVARADEQAPGARRYTSLVPTQLVRLLATTDGVQTLRRLDAVLVGGASTSKDVLDRARSLGVNVVTTYGMSETCGGCVYDGRSIPGVQVRLREGRVHLGGAPLAHGYLDDGRLSDGGVFTTEPSGVADMVAPSDPSAPSALPAPSAPPAPSASPAPQTEPTRWFRTDDLAHVSDGRLVIDGRVDDVIITGGLKVLPRDVERALEPLLPDGAAVAVVGVPDPEWGHCVGAVFVPRPSSHTGTDSGTDTGTDTATGTSTDTGTDAGIDAGTDDETLAALTDLGARIPEILEAARSVLPPHAVPRRVSLAPALPLRGPGKPDREALRLLLTTEPHPASATFP